MSKKHIRSDILTKLGQVSRDLSIFSSPSQDQRNARARFWAKYSSGDLQPPAHITPEIASAGASDRRVVEWWSIPGFPDWFTNGHEFRERVEFLTSLALDSVEEILRNRDASASARIAAVKIVLEVANKFPKGQQEEQYSDERIQQMDEKELEQFINSRIGLVAPNADT